MNPFFLLPAIVLGFLGGAAFGAPSRKGMSMKPSPLPGVPLIVWEKFVSVMVVAPKGEKSPRGRLGVFQMDPRRLKDVGVMKTVGKKTVNGRPGVWSGQWSEPLTEAAFLGSMPLQYAAFARSMKAAVPKVSGLVGEEVDGVRCSLSGLLGIVHAAGEAGVPAWVADKEVRKHFPRTAEVFARTNGIF